MLTLEQFKPLIKKELEGEYITLSVTFKDLADEKIIKYINDERKFRIQQRSKELTTERLTTSLYYDYQWFFLKSRGVEKFNLNNSYEELKKLY